MSPRFTGPVVEEAALEANDNAVQMGYLVPTHHGGGKR